MSTFHFFFFLFLQTGEMNFKDKATYSYITWCDSTVFVLCYFVYLVMAYLSVVDIKHATSAVDQLTVTGLLRYGQVASLRRLQVVQFRYGAPVIRSLFVIRSHPHMCEFTSRRSSGRSKYNTRKRNKRLSYSMTLWENWIKNKKRHDETRKKLFLEYTEEMCDEEQSVNGNGRRKRAQGVSLPAAGCNIK
jgi:hypothetical protein